VTDQTKEPTAPKAEDSDAPWELPDRPALSIIGSGSSLPLPGVDGVMPTTDSTATPAPDAAGTAGQASDSAGGFLGTAGEASGGGTESVTDADRSETFTSSDSASAES
jgi:hypothetical protein